VATIRFAIARAGRVRAAIYDGAGALVETLVDGPVDAGEHAAVWNAAGRPSGIYFCVLTSGAWSRAVPLVIAR
jgi:hypothetical protein